MKMNLWDGRLLAAIAGIVVVAAVSASIWLNPPSENRARALDRVRLSGLQRVEAAINRYYDLHHALPVDLNALESGNTLLAQQDWHDPQTNQPYEFAITDATAYQLCANFSRSSDKAENEYDLQFRRHDAGRTCFQYRAGQR